MPQKNVLAEQRRPNESRYKYWTPSNGDSYTLKVHETTVIITAGSGVTATLNLPNVYDAEGIIYALYEVDGTGSVSVKATGSIDWTDLTMDADNDAVLLMAQGGKWWILDNQIA